MPHWAIQRFSVSKAISACAEQEVTFTFRADLAVKPKLSAVLLPGGWFCSKLRSALRNHPRTDHLHGAEPPLPLRNL